jgi:hypothetical protein
MSVGVAGAGSASALVGVISAEFIQKHETTEEDCEGNPEMDVGGDHAEQVARGRAGDREFRQISNLVV